MMSSSVKDHVFAYRNKFKRLDRKWHLLIGSQILFGLFAFRVRNLHVTQQNLRRRVSQDVNNNNGSEPHNNDNDKTVGNP